MYKKALLFITTIFTAISASTGYGSTDSLKGTVPIATFLDWFNSTEKYVPAKGLMALDLIPALFLISVVVMFYKDGKKIKGLLAALALLLNLVGVFLVIQYANPIATQMTGWTAQNVPSDWVSQKDEWIKYIGLYGLTGLVGWICFLTSYFVPAKKTDEFKKRSRFLHVVKNAVLFVLTFSFGLSVTRLYEYGLLPYGLDISGTTFIEMHRPLDIAIRKAGPFVFLFMSVLFVLLATLFFVEKSKRKGWLVVGAYLCLLADTVIALQGNGPLNDLFHTWTPTSIPENWTIFRDEWLRYHFFRDIFLMLLFIQVLLTYYVTEKKKPVQTI